MGKKTGFVALAVGVFLLFLAGLSKFYLYDTLATVPLDQDTTTVSKTAEGDDATYLNLAAEDGPAIETGPLVSTRNVVGQVDMSKRAADSTGEDVAVWDTYSYTAPPEYDAESGDEPLSGTRDVVAFDRVSGEAVPWSSATSESNGQTKKVQFEGQYFKFPFNTQKKTYEFWDGSIGEATDANYVQTETLEGLTVYKFEQVIEPTKIAELDAPGNLVGEPDEDAVATDRMYSNTRSFWVEPETGVIIKGQEQQLATLDVDGQSRATITEATLAYDDATVKNTVDEYSGKASALHAIRVWVPLIGLILGIALTLLGVILIVRGSRSKPGGQRVAE